MREFVERISAAMERPEAWWQGPMLVVLLLGVLLILYVARTQQTEFIYALF